MFNLRLPVPGRTRVLSSGLRIAAFLATTALTTVAAHAQTTTWIEGLGAGNTWTGSTNWNNGVPDINTDAIVPTVGNSGPSFVIQDNTVDGAARSVQLGSTLQVRQGGILDVAQGFLGTASTSKLWVDDSNSTVTVGGVLTFDQGGEVRVTAGGTLVTQGGALLSGVAGSADRFEGDINGGTWTNTGDMTLGGAGNGYMIVRSNGTLTTGNLTLGEFAGGWGEMYIGSSSTVTSTNTADIGDAGYGEVRIGSGGTFKTQIGRVGNSAGGSGLVTVDSGTWTNGGTLTVGVKGEGAVLVQGGGTLETESLVLGAETSSAGFVTVTGSGSKLNTEATTYVGQEGAGSLQVLNDAVANIGLTPSNDLVLGYNTDANGSVRVAGGGTLNGTGGLIVGAAGMGRMEINGAGSNAFFNAMTVGSSIGSTGDVVLTNGAGLSITSTATVGYGGTGSLDLSGGSTFVAGDLFVASSDPASRGTVRVDNSTLGVTGHIELATYGTAEMIVSNGSALSSYSLRIAADSGSSGSLTLSNSTWVNGSHAEIGAGGVGILSLTQGATGDIGGDLTIGNVNGTGRGELAISNGTVNVAGTLTQYANSTYAYTIGNGPLAGGGVNVTGAATIEQGAQLAARLSGSVAAGDQFVVLTSADSVTGTYTLLNGGQVTAFLSVNAIYDPDQVTLVVNMAMDFADAGLTRNQIATAGGLQSLGAGNPLYDIILNIPTADQARNAFDQLSGEVHASVRGAMLDDSRFPREAALNRLRSAMGGVGASRGPVAAMDAYGAYASVDPMTDRVVFWGQGFGSWGHWNSDGNAARLGRSTGGFIAGVDGSIDAWRIGAFGGYSASRFNVDARNSSGSSDNYHAGLYSGTTFGGFAFRSGLAYTWHDVTTTRNVAFQGFSDRLKADYHAGTAQVFGEFAHGYRAGAMAFEPFANLAYVSLRTDGFTESGGAAALNSRSATADATFTTLGLRASTDIVTGATATTLRGSLGWRHVLGDTTPLVGMAFASGGSPFTIAGVPIAENAAVVDLGLDMKVAPNAMLGISYGGQFGSDAIDQTIRANFTAKF